MKFLALVLALAGCKWDNLVAPPPTPPQVAFVNGCANTYLFQVSVDGRFYGGDTVYWVMAPEVALVVPASRGDHRLDWTAFALSLSEVRGWATDTVTVEHRTTYRMTCRY